MTNDRVTARTITDAHDKPRPGFYAGHESWYWDATRIRGTRARITVGLYYSPVGCDFEFSFLWRDSLDFATLELHDDGWPALTDPRFVALFATMSRMPRPVEPDHVFDVLVGLGFVDLTDREGPRS